jgi:hypothetical protein
MALLGAAYYNQFGSFAKSPQRLLMTPGRPVIVAGGKAMVNWVDMGMGPEIEVECKGQHQHVDLFLDHEPTDEICGVRLRLIEYEEVHMDPQDLLDRKKRMTSKLPTAEVEVTWKQ